MGLSSFTTLRIKHVSTLSGMYQACNRYVPGVYQVCHRCVTARLHPNPEPCSPFTLTSPPLLCRISTASCHTSFTTGGPTGCCPPSSPLLPPLSVAPLPFMLLLPLLPAAPAAVTSTVTVEGVELLLPPDGAAAGCGSAAAAAAVAGDAGESALFAAASRGCVSCRASLSCCCCCSCSRCCWCCWRRESNPCRKRLLGSSHFTQDSLSCISKRVQGSRGTSARRFTCNDRWKG